MGIIGSIFSGNNARTAATRAANAQVQGAQAAQGEIAKGEQAGQNFLNNEWTGQQATEAPYQQLGSTSANELNRFLQTPFQTPTLQQAEQMPGYQFQLQQGTQALNENAAATGNLMSGTQGEALENYGQGLAQTDYNNLYNQALNTYMTNYNTLLGGTQAGLTSAGQLGQEGAMAAGQDIGLNLGGAEAQAQQINNAAAARASGYVGKANATNSMMNNIDSQLMEAALMAGM